MKIKRLIIDVLKPHEPSIVVFAEQISELDGIGGITIKVHEIDEKTETLAVAVEGKDLDFEDIKEAIEKLGGSVHSIDLVSAGSKNVSPRED
jgi:hypothetical protein